jgi:GNAT superfamily N-acetyltransferase
VAYVGPELLAGDHLLDGFDCGKPALSQWLIRRAPNNQASGTSRTWVVVEAGSRDVVAFYASATASILRSSAPEPMRRNQPEEMPAILLARMAVDSRHHRRGLGAALLKHFMLKAFEVAQLVGVRVVLVHAKDDEAKSFYIHYGFGESPFDPLVLMMLLGDA